MIWPAAFFLGGFMAAWLLSGRRGYAEGFHEGEDYGRRDGWRQAWLKHMRYRRMGNLKLAPLASDQLPMLHKTQDWYED